MIRELLNEKWKMCEVGSSEKYDTSIPASVLSVLIDNNKIENPYFRDNELKCMELLEKDYEFSCVFSVIGDYMREDEIDLIFGGIDTVGVIYLNGEKIASVADMHRTYRFHVKNKVRAGANEIKIVLKSPLKYMEEYKVNAGKESDYSPSGTISGSRYMRKAHSMSGCNFGPKLPDMGIFRNVEIEAYSKARIKDVFFSQIHERDTVKLVIDPVLHITDNIPMEILIHMTGQEDVTSVIHLPEEGATETPREINKIVIPVKNPMLWWPNGMGEQPLYDVNIVVKKSDNVYDERRYRIGLRTINVSTKNDEYGNEFAFEINGVKMFAMGANYVPEDCLYSKISAEKQERLIRSAARANYNTIRVWGGGYYPSDDFYDLCDEYGLVVWQDLMFVRHLYNLDEAFENNIVNEISENIVRLRHHACLGLWCGNDETEAMWCEESSFAKSKPYLQSDYIKIFEHIIPKVVRDNDDKTFFWPSSPSSGGCFDNPSDEKRGDTHYWEVWNGDKPYSEYQNHFFRFLSEFGFQSFPSVKTINEFTITEDRNIYSYIMEHHQKNNCANSKIMRYISETFQNPSNLENTVYVSQILQGMAIKCCVQHLRRNRGICMGTLYWQMNDVWPAVSWSGIDYFGRWKALQYMAKEFFEPLAGSLLKLKNADGKATGKVRAYVVNDTLNPSNVKIIQTLYTFDGKELVHYEDSGRVLPGKVFGFNECDYERFIAKNGRRNVYLEVQFVYTDGRIRYEYETFEPYKYLNLKNPKITYSVAETEDMYEISLVSDTFTPFVVVDLIDRDAIFENNVVSLTAEKPISVFLYKDEISDGPFESVDDFCDHLDISFLQKSYMNYDVTEEAADNNVD